MWQQWKRSRKTKEGMKLSLPPKLVEKLVWVPIISFCKISFSVIHLMACKISFSVTHLMACKISFSVTHLMAYYAETGRSHPLIA
jgi:hypothetical protein